MSRFLVSFLVGLWLLLGANAAEARQFRVTPFFGGLPAGSGLALGIELYRPRAAGPVDLRIRAVGSSKRYGDLEAGFELPRVGTNWIFAEFKGRYRNYPEEDFWGLGPNTPRNRRSNFRMEDAGATAVLGMRLWRRLSIRAVGGFLNTNTGAGQDDSLPSVDQQFSLSEVPALDFQPRYWHTGVRVDVDTRDVESDPRSGGLYQFDWTLFRTRDGTPFNFRDYKIELQRFFAISERGRLAFRGRTVFTDSTSSHQVPFFLQPWTGGSDTIRGFHQYRFRDGNALVLNAEYRHELFALVDLVGFADAGRVFSRPSDFGFADLKPAGGLGVRVKFGSRVFLGIDAGTSSEGTHVWFRGGHTF